MPCERMIPYPSWFECNTVLVVGYIHKCLCANMARCQNYESKQRQRDKERSTVAPVLEGVVTKRMLQGYPAMSGGVIKGADDEAEMRKLFKANNFIEEI